MMKKVIALLLACYASCTFSGPIERYNVVWENIEINIVFSQNRCIVAEFEVL